MEKITSHFSKPLNKTIIHYELYNDFGFIYSCMAYSVEEAREKKNKYLGETK